MIDSLRKNETVSLYDNGTPLRDIMQNDVCTAINLVCMEGKLNEIYNIGEGSRIGIIRSARTYLNSYSR